MLQRKLRCRKADSVALRQAIDRLLKVETGERLVGIDKEITVGAKGREHIDNLEQRRILHDQTIRLEDRLAQPNLLIRNPAEGDNRRTSAFRSKTWEGLRVAPFQKGRDRQYFCTRHDALTSAAMDANLEHAPSFSETIADMRRRSLA